MSLFKRKGVDEKGVRVALYHERLGDGKVRCRLCPHECTVSDGKRGICGVRENRNGDLFTLVFGTGTSAAVDPIEKKPLYHLFPGSTSLSFGTVGCNLSCQHCQNYTISQMGPEDMGLRLFTVEGVLELARNSGVDGVSWTYNEPTVWYEFTLEASKVLRKEGFFTSYVSNGFINEAPFRELAPHLDAINVDVKSHSEDFYKKVCKARLGPVHETCELAVELGVLLELTYLIIPSKNDTREQLKGFSRWVVDSLGQDVPVHFSAFHPDYKFIDLPRTPLETLEKAFGIAKEAGCRYVYLGNVPHGDYENTYCPYCSGLLVERFGFSANIVGLKDGKCEACGAVIPIRH